LSQLAQPDPWRKLGRAEHHLKTLGEQWDAFLGDDETYAVEHELRHEPPILVWQTWFAILRPIPPELSLTAGDLFGNLRACLDHLIGAFVLRFGGEIKGHHAFPLYGREDAFIGAVKKVRRKRDRGGPLQGIPTESAEWALVEEAQPYKRGKDWRQHPLAELNTLVNIDKHRGLHASMAYPEAKSALDLLEWSPEAELIGHDPHWRPGQPLEHGTELATLRFASPEPSPNVRVKNPVTLGVAFGSHDTPRDTLPPSIDDTLAYLRDLLSTADLPLL
jgi:hypothetical protein